MDPQHERLLVLVQQARRERGLAKQKDFIKATGLGRTTIQRFERGEHLSDTAYRSIDWALGWMAGSCLLILEGGEAILRDDQPAPAPAETADPMAALRDRLPLRVVHELERGKVYDTLSYDLTPDGGARVITVVIVDHGSEAEISDPVERAKVERAWSIEQRRLRGLPRLAPEPGDSEEDG